MPSPSIFTSIINSYLPEPHASLLNGILFGINLKTGKELYEQLKITGLLHLVVLSGINITILASITTILTINFGKRISLLLTILNIILFISFVGPQAPIVRAGVMGIITVVSILYGRKNIALYSLFISLIVVAVFWPKWLNSISLQLSYGATIGIILFGNIHSRPAANTLQSIFDWIKKEMRPSLAAQLFTVPIIFYHFKQISLIAPVSNLLVAFLIYPLMIFGFITAILGKIHYVLGVIPSLICYGMLQYMIFIIETLSKLPFVFFSFHK